MRLWPRSLLWRSVLLIALLLVLANLAWLQIFRVSERTPRARQTAQQIASLVNLSRAALIHSDSIQRVSLIKALDDQEGVRISPREPGDRFVTFDSGGLDTRIVDELVSRLGPGTVISGEGVRDSHRSCSKRGCTAQEFATVERVRSAAIVVR